MGNRTSTPAVAAITFLGLLPSRRGYSSHPSLHGKTPAALGSGVLSERLCQCETYTRRPPNPRCLRLTASRTTGLRDLSL